MQAAKQIPTIGQIPKEKKREIETKFAQLIKGEKDQSVFKYAKLLLDKLFDEKTPTYNFTSTSGWQEFYNLWSHLPDEKQGLREEIGKIVSGILHQRGFRSNIATWQEHTILGSTTWVGYSKTPYVPLGILKGGMAVEEVQLARELEVTQNAFLSYYGGKEGELIQVTSEPLDSEGKTIRDPRVIDMDKMADFFKKGVPLAEAIEGSLVRNLVKSPDFPAPRN